MAPASATYVRMSDARHPDLPGGQPWPRPGVSAIIVRDQAVLLVERAAGALKGRWSPPGGHIEPGERMRAAALREVREETGVEAEIGGLVDVHEAILRDGEARLSAHYLLAVFWGRWLAGEPAAHSDAAAARFVGLDELSAYPLTDGAEALIRRAWNLAQGHER
ncbi:MAG TPA: NUDIX hydrolase [Hyphomicrobiaceae bacterium]|nr:NUDIX hydrolase [Hyphomicrobiaceae bacterium]